MTPPWLAQAAAVPVAFAQVREDPRVDLAVLDRLPPDAAALMVASGGCTAAALAASGRLARLDLVDVNPAQLALARLKLHLLEHETTSDRLALCGHADMSDRGPALAALLDRLGLPTDALGPPALLAQLGPDHAGRYELLFDQLRRAMGPTADALPDLLSSPDAAAHFAPGTPHGDALDAAFDGVMSLPNLVALFGAAATANRVQPFARHFAGRTRVALATLPTADNPFLWQLLVGRFPPATPYDWFAAVPPARLPKTSFLNFPAADVLWTQPEVYDFVHLSNVLDWLAPAEATETLADAASALRPGGRVLIRQLNSTLDLPALGPQFDWLDTTALHAADRSFFYRQLHLGRRRP